MTQIFAAAAGLLAMLASNGMAQELSSAPIDPARLSETTRVLASDEFEGRAPGTAGEAKTIEYLTRRFAALGLEPASEDGSWTQKVPLIRTQIALPAAATVTANGKPVQLQFGRDIYLNTRRPVHQVKIDNAPLVFVGYGVHAPERQWDDFKGADLKGKVAVFLLNDPDFEAAAGDPVANRFGGPAMTYYGRWTYKFEEAARRGAIAALLVHETAAVGGGWSTVIAPAGESFDVAKGSADATPLLLEGWLHRDAAAALFRRAGLDLKALKLKARTAAFRPFELGNAGLSADLRVKVSHTQTHNVLAKLTGKTKPGETVMFAAHWDALGIGTADAQGRTILPGALDNAIGVAGLLEAARAAAAGPRPDRTLVFAAWAAEESGTLGSEYYAANPLYPHELTAANLTFDVLQTAGLSRDVSLIGHGQNTLEDDLAGFAAKQNRTVTPDSRPERGLFYRSDHFPFAQRGVPVLLMMALGGGADLIDGGRAAGDRWVSDYTANCYHQTCDLWSAGMDFRGAAQDVALAYGIGLELANSRRWPAWKAGSEFEAVRRKTDRARR